MARERDDLEEPEACPLTPGDYVVKNASSPSEEYVVSVYGKEFESGVRTSLSSGDSFRIVSSEPAQISYQESSWYVAGSPGKPARPHDGFWPAVSVEVKQGGETIQGFMPVFFSDRIEPRP
jgi:hypothetical protein